MNITELVKIAHQDSIDAGWHKSPRDKGTLFMLIVSEIVKAMEAERKNLMDDKLPHRKMAEVELADAVIRICDYCGLYGYDLESAIIQKMEYNKIREDHKPEVRAKEGGKAW